MSKSNHFFGQPLYGQLINLLDKEKILELSRSKGGERYIKRFDAWTHLVTMLYAVIMRHDSLREISVSMLAEARKLSHIGITMMPTRSTLSDASARRPEAIFESIYRWLYKRYSKEALLGPPRPLSGEMDETVANHRFYHDFAIFKPIV